MNNPTDDSSAGRRIVRDLDANLIVEAGAGTGKTYALVSRVVALVKAGVRMENIVAITFTEMAAAELSERIRARMDDVLDDEYRATSDDPLVQDGMERPDLRKIAWSDEELQRISDAIAELDRASIQTIHSFAAQLLRQRPMAVGLPPGWTQWDELDAAQDFTERWEEWLEWALGNGPDADAQLQRVLRHLLATGIGLGHWRDLAAALRRAYHSIPDENCLPSVDLPAICRDALEALQSLANECGDESDVLFQQLGDAIVTVEAVADAADDPVAAAEALADGSKVDYSGNVGTRRNWSVPTTEVRAQFRETGTTFQQSVRSAVLSPLLQNLHQRFAVGYAEARKADGAATFDDLLVWARDLLRDNDDARRYFQSRYTHILIDEFQDTDPLQAEIGFYLAATGDAPVGNQDWHTLPLAPGRLFIVGDAKQSIYRFRGADLGVVQQVKRGGQLDELTLSENRRSQQAILEWVNAVFGQVMGADASGLQAEYVPLQPNAGVQQDGLDAGVRVFGEPSDGRADDVRRREAAQIARLIAGCTTDGADRLNVYDKDRRCSRPARLGDVCILVRTRTGLGILERALEDAGIPYRIEGGSLLFDTQEVQDLLNCLRAIDNPADAVAVAAALRSSAFACSDVDLLNWRETGATWNYLDMADGVESSPVRDGMARLHEYHRRRHDTPVSRLISEFVRERRLEELDLVEYRPREMWRRRQFLVEQARILETDGPTAGAPASWNLHQFIRWAELQRDDASRINELPAPESDDDAVRIMTMHSAKGLEFPIVILRDLDYAPRTDAPTVLVDPDTGMAAVSIGAASARIRTPEYAALSEIETVHHVAEEVRLAYVAATRARDHLLVSRHCRQSNSGAFPNAIIETIVEQSEALPQREIETIPFAPTRPPAAGTANSLTPLAYDKKTWQEQRAASIANRNLQQAVTATWVARQAAAHSAAREEAEAAIEDKDAEPDEEQPWLGGRGGTAFGSALHAVLQYAMAEILPQLPAADDEVLAQLREQLDRSIDRLSGWQASEGGVHGSADAIAGLAKRAVRHESVVAALKAPKLWPEIPVATQLDTPNGPVVIEGIIDLLYLDHDDRLVIVDYKSDAVANDAEAQAKMEHYQWQGASYAAAVERAAGKKVKDVQFLFVRRDQARSIPNLPELLERLPQVVSERSQGHPK